MIQTLVKVAMVRADVFDFFGVRAHALLLTQILADIR